MIVLGLSFGYHDSTVALVEDGVVKRVISEERLTLQKHDFNFPKFAIEKCLEVEGLSFKDIDLFVYHEDPHNKFSRVLCSSLYHFPFSQKEFVNSVKAWMGKKLWAIGKISNYFNCAHEKVSYLNHHYSHALQAFMGSGQESAAILIVDAVGDWSSTAFYKGKWIDGVPFVEKIKEVAYPDSLGLVYSAVTGYLGFTPNDSECSTMALAAFGTPRFLKKVDSVITSDNDSTYSVVQKYFHFMDFYKGTTTKDFISLFGEGKEVNEEYDLSSFKDLSEQEISSKNQQLADIAASFQTKLELVILELCEELKEITGETNLCYAGGVALNCVANKTILDSNLFESVYIPPDPGDGGTAVGIALYQSYQKKKETSDKSVYGPYQGVEFKGQFVTEMIEELRDKSFKKYLKSNVTSCDDWSVDEYSNETELNRAISKDLMDSLIVGWFQGAFELGPRALGNRSILFRPDCLDTANKVSTTVKERASFRPYALSMTIEDAGKVLKTEQALENFKWMQFACDVNTDVVKQVRSGLHADLTTRPQVCSAQDNPKFHSLLSHFGEKFGLSALVNTSFNPKGYPIVSSPYEALAMFARTDMNVLVINNTIIRKVYN